MKLNPYFRSYERGGYKKLPTPEQLIKLETNIEWQIMQSNFYRYVDLKESGLYNG